jgi:hypothetical protein
MSWWVIALFFGLYLVILLTVTRIRAELGPPVHDFHRMGPDLMLTRLWGTANLPPHDLGMLALYWWFNRAYRGLPMAHQIEGLKLAERVEMPLGRMAFFLWLSGVVGFFAAVWAFLHLAFELGTAAKFWSGAGYGWQNYSALIHWLENPTDPDWMAAGAVGIGFITCVALQLLRWRFLHFPFHPIGYLISSSWSINLVWMPLLISWLIKVLIVRHGGLRLYRRTIPFFLGLIFGDCLIGSFWALLGIALGIPTYSFWGA